jgi:hypothetical protein
MEILTPQTALIKKYAKMFNLLRTIGAIWLQNNTSYLVHTMWLSCDYLFVFGKVCCDYFIS